MNKSKYKERYAPQILFSQIGEEGQKKLSESRAVVVGCGGLGSNIANNMARAGIGFIRIIDSDKIELSNLQRQQLFDEEDVRKKIPKAIVAKNKLSLINSNGKIDAVADVLNSKNIKKYFHDIDLVLDGTDNLESRFLIDRFCKENNISWIFGAVAASYGMVCSIIPNSGYNLKSIFAGVPGNFNGLSSENVGILNSAVNVISSIQTTEAIKILVGDFNSLIKGLIIVDIWDLAVDIVDINISERKS